MAAGVPVVATRAEPLGIELITAPVTPELIAALVAGVREELGGADENDLMARRDLALRELMATKKRLGLD